MPRFVNFVSNAIQSNLTQQTGGDELPRSFTAAFEQEYGRVRAELRQKRST